jgi:hypothetical protein
VTEQLHGDDLAEDFEPDASPDFTDADAFFATEVLPARAAILRMYGRDYPLPADVPIAFTLLSERYLEESGLEPFRKILSPLFGADTLDYWIERGCGARRLGIVLGWVIGNINEPGSLSLADAAERHDAATAGKAQSLAPATTIPNRAERRRRGGSGRRSSSTGR